MVNNLMNTTCNRKQFLLLLGSGAFTLLNLKRMLAFNLFDRLFSEREIETESLTVLNCGKIDTYLDKEQGMIFNKGNIITWTKVAKKDSKFVGLKFNSNGIGRWKITINGKEKILVGKEIKINMSLQKFDKIEVSVEKINEGEVIVKDITLYYGN